MILQEKMDLSKKKEYLLNSESKTKCGYIYAIVTDSESCYLMSPTIGYDDCAYPYQVICVYKHDLV